MNSEHKKSAHQVLFKNLNLMDDKTKWLSNPVDERIVQFVAYPDKVIARLNEKPNYVVCQQIENTFGLNQEIDVVVKLCGSLERKKKKVDSVVTIVEGKILNQEERIEFSNQILQKAGLEVFSVAVQDTDNIKFTKNNRVVQIKTFEAYAKCKIVNLEHFISAWNIGLGRRRTWGCGMLRLQD